jgi:hypothetical protein
MKVGELLAKLREQPSESSVLVWRNHERGNDSIVDVMDGETLAKELLGPGAGFMEPVVFLVIKENRA